MYYQRPFIFTALLGAVIDAMPIPLFRTSLDAVRAGNSDFRFLLWGRQDNRDLAREDTTVHESRAAHASGKVYTIGAYNVTGTDAEDDDDSVIPEAFLEGDSDSGGESNVGNTAVSVANALLGSGGGTGSAALNGVTSGSTSAFCSLLACSSAAQSDGKVSTTAAVVNLNNVTGPLISITGPLIVVVTHARLLASHLADVTTGLP